ncbi:hypothetical protein [Streptomyces sp. NBC_01264]|uniref:hypothetical protein n=1 Tax=Streptomyces sp. NBC_01264 TaxID=2903804 RepID=UPI002258F39F|nr:hypothetical protein [Streptomyces sp. NBC_01264]MCX4784110.1 hypothetical protein [Streptomyces sp. NBC_01264]
MRQKERPAGIRANLVVALGVVAFVVAVAAGRGGQIAAMTAALAVVLVCTGWLARDGWLRRRRTREGAGQ